MDIADLQDYASEIAQDIINQNYRNNIDSNNSEQIQEIRYILNNNELINLILGDLLDTYTNNENEAMRLLDDYIDFNQNILNNVTQERDNRNRIINTSQDNNIIEIPESVINNIPQNVLDIIKCPISLEIMRDPVITSVGQTYDRSSIETTISRNLIDPITRQPITNNLIPNFAIKSLINSYVPMLGGSLYVKKHMKSKKHIKSKKHMK